MQLEVSGADFLFKGDLFGCYVSGRGAQMDEVIQVREKVAPMDMAIEDRREDS